MVMEMTREYLMAQQTKVLLVCLGNICRSPTAHAVLERRLELAGLAEHVKVDSAGTYGGHAGEPADERARHAAEKRGYAMHHLRARKVNDVDFDEFDLILGMDKENIAHLKYRCPEHHLPKLELFLSYGSMPVDEVPDPYYGAESGFEYVLDLVEDACDGLIAHLAKQHKAA